MPASGADRASDQQSERAPRLGWRLVAVHGDVRPPHLTLVGPSWTIGRAAENAIVVVRDAVSRHHAVIVREGESFRLSDTDSRNGTYLNGELLRTSRFLAHRDLIGLGEPQPQLRFVDEHALADPLPSRHAAPRDDRPRLVFDDRRLRFTLYDRSLDLSPDEFRLLHYLYQSDGAVCARPECAEAIWGNAAPRHEDALDRLVDRLRRKLRHLEPQFDIVQTRITGGFILQL
ncbi:MAG TPA: FHA domain-containing protein [Thermomicrobiales bacterium]|jgi:hypothetical protein